MSEESLDTFFDNIVQVLMKDLAFYISSDIIPDIVFEKVGSQIPVHFFDEIYILDIHQGFGVFEIEEFNERLIQKPKLFEKTIFQLLKKRKELDDFEFDYILEKYFDKVEFYSAIVNWLSINLSLYNNQIDMMTKGVFEIQSEIYKTHFIELINYFYPSEEIVLKQYYDLSEIIKVYIPDFISRLGQYSKEFIIESTIDIPQQEIKEDQKNSPIEQKPVLNLEPNKKDKKIPLITEKEAEDFLLTTVFNIKLDDSPKKRK